MCHHNIVKLPLTSRYNLIHPFKLLAVRYLVILVTLCLNLPFSNSQNALFIPDTIAGESINLTLDTGHVVLYDGFSTNSIGYNQALLGPTIILKQGQDVVLNVQNDLEEATTLHWHGLHVSAENDGGPHTVIEAGSLWSPSFTVLDHAATFWYHPHLHENTERQVTEGAAGLIIVRDDEEAQLALPRTYGVDDFPVVMQSRAFDADKQFMDQTAADEVMMINGTLDAYLDVPAQFVRLRLLNGSTERVYNLGLEGNLSFYQIASDGGLLDKPVTLTRMLLSPGERAEILIDMNSKEGQSIKLMSFASEMPNGIYGAANPSVMPMGSIPGYDANALNGSDFTVLQLNVTGQNTNPITTVPDELTTNIPYSESDAQITRTLLFRPKQQGPQNMLTGPFTINGKSFDLDFIDYEIPFDNTEIWELTNSTAISHPFHIHNVEFFILDINGQQPQANMQGRKDVVLVPPMGGTVRFITKFEDHSNEEVPFMYHCHMLSHEDDGMMGQFIVLDNTTSTVDHINTSIKIFPNPTSDFVTISNDAPMTIEVYNNTGQLILVRDNNRNVERIDMTNLSSGAYTIQIYTSDIITSYNVVRN
jgi:bilirubin oxidase